MDYKVDSAGDIESINAVQLIDLEDSVLLRPGKTYEAIRSGTSMWRSPEAWTWGAKNSASDIFSSAVVAINLVLNKQIFHLDQDFADGELAQTAVLQRHISYFGNDENIIGLLVDHLGTGNHESTTKARDIVNMSLDLRSEWEPFHSWESVDPCFKDLVMKMTSLDPAGRISARGALGHPWFDGVADPVRG